MSIDDVRRALFNAYKKAEQIDGGFEGKTSEGYCEAVYSTYWDYNTIEEFVSPIEIMVYSYALGPNRKHYFRRGTVEKQVSSNEWVCVDVCRKAVEVINSWADELDA